MDKRTGLRYAFRIAIGISMLVLLLGNDASAATITVPTDYAKIQWAIDNATAGDTIEVHSGTYYENVNVNKQLNLTGIGSPVVDAGGVGNAMILSAGSSKFEGFDVTNAINGIYINSSDNIVKSNNATTNTKSGIEIFCYPDWDSLSIIRCSSNILIDNIVSNNSIGFYLSSYHYMRGDYGSSYNNILVGNIASYNSDWGIFIENMRSGIAHTSETYVAEAHNNISYNIVSNNGNGIYLHSGNNILIGNNASNNTNIGISLDSTIRIIMTAPLGPSYIGDAWGVGDNTLSYNTISNNGNGIYVYNSTDNTLIGNNILSNNNGIILNNSKSNLIYNNYFSNVNNAINSGNNSWNTTKTSGPNIVGGPSLGGNVWAYPNGTGFSQTCPDINKDGICDLPNTLDSNNIDYLPLAYNIIPPAGVTNLTNISYAMNYINWTWTDPSEPDFYHVEVYLNSVFETNVSSGVQSYTATNLTPDTQYTIGIKTVDTAGNVNATPVTAIATTAEDTTAPVITLLGTSPVTIEVNSEYTDAGATASDNYDGVITASIVTVNPVNTATIGTYTVTYNVNDSSDNAATEVTRIVNVVDTTAPAWNPVPSNQIVQVGISFSYDVNADDQTQVNYSINDTVNFAIDQVTGLITNITALNVGTYGLNITATDTSSNSVSQIITVTVQAEPTYSVSGYVFDNKNARLAGVSVQNGSKQATTTGSGNYSIAGLMNGSYNFSYTKSGFDTGYLEVMVNEANLVNANKTIFDNTPPGQVTGLENDTPTQTTVNLNWNPVANASYYQVYRDSALAGTTLNTYWNDTSLSPGTAYQYQVRANDSYNNWGENSSISIVRTAPPIIAPIVIKIVSPDDKSANNTGFINVTVTLDRTGTALLNWDGSNESMVGDGTHFYKNKTGLLSGNYSFRVYANDSNGVFNASETRIVTVNRTIMNYRRLKAGGIPSHRIPIERR